MVNKTKTAVLFLIFSFAALASYGQGNFDGNARPQQGHDKKAGFRDFSEKRAKINKHLNIAEAHRGLAQMYEEQGKVEEAVAELYKIIELFKAKKTDLTQDEDQTRQNRTIKNIFFVYEHIARLYAKNQREEESIKTLNEAIDSYKGQYPEEVGRMMLFLSELYKKNKNFDKAEELYKEVIKLNSN
jgi:tetratricopeptide (TPR) repeat protein